MRSSRDSAGVRWTGVGPVAPERQGRRVQLASAEFRQVAPRRANVLLTGPDDAVAHLFAAVENHLRQPVTVWVRRRALVLPGAGEGTLLIRDVDALTRAQQQRLFDWLTRRLCRTQVISTTVRPLLSEVQADRFMAELFYRLNVIAFDLT